jgi:hypothetical protein
MTANLLRDAHVLPVARRQDLRAAAGRVRAALGDGGLAGRDPATAAAAIGHAVAFETWHSLSGEGLDDPAIVDLMLVFVGGAAAGSSPKARSRSAGRAEPSRPKASAGRAEPPPPKGAAERPGTSGPNVAAEPPAPAAIDQEAPKKPKGGKAKGGKKDKDKDRDRAKDKGKSRAKGDRKAKTRGSGGA